MLPSPFLVKMIKKTKFSTITAIVVTIAAIAALGSIGGGLGQQQMALAQVDSRDIGEDGIDVGDITGEIGTEIGEDDDQEDDDNGGGELVSNICAPGAPPQFQRTCEAIAEAFCLLQAEGDIDEIVQCRA